MKFLCLCVFVCILAVAHSKTLTKGVTCADKKTIVNLHNKLRKSVATGSVKGQPKASNMQAMVWDDELGRRAQAWADKKKFEHSKNQDDSRFQVGENLYISYSTDKNQTFNWAVGIQAWFDEYKLYTYKPLVSDPATGHYTQIVWADTIYVGCGATCYLGPDNMTNKLYVCNYGPAGNWLKQYPYKTGKGCENLCCSKQCDKSKMYGKTCK